MNPVSLMADAGKLSVSQLQQAVKNGTVPAYIGIPMMQEKMKQAKQAQVAQAPTEPPIAQQVMAEASGIDQMPSNLPVATAKDGGIVSFADGGDVEDFDQEAYEDQQDEAEYAQAIEDRLNAAEQGGATNINHTPSVEGGIKGGHKGYDEHTFVRGVSGSHKGIDYAMPVGTPVSPKVEGTLRYNTKDKNGWGNAAEIVGENGQVLQRFAHLSKFAAPEGSRVKPGQVIAMSGNTGRSTGPHLHVENFYADGGIARLNVPRFNGKKGSVPGYDAMGNYTGEVDLEEDTTPSSEPYKDNLEGGSGHGTKNIPGMITPAGAATGVFRQQRSIKPSVIGMPETDFLPQQDVSRLGFTPNAPSSVPSVQNAHPSDFLGEMSGNPQNPLDFLGSSSSVKTPFAGDTTEADRLLRRYPAPKSQASSTATADKNTDSGSTAGSNTGATGERQKSEYDLIREDIMNQREELKRQKQEDKYMAIMQAGLGMMAGTSPNAFANIGQGASAGIAQYGASGKQRAAENAALNKGLITAQRYKSMDEYQRAALADRAAGRTELAGYRADERGDRNDLKQAELDARIDKQLADAITNNSAKIDLGLLKKYGEPALMSAKDKAAYDAERAKEYGQKVNHYIEIQNNRLQQRYPDIFKDSSSVRPAAPSNRISFGNL